MALSAFSAFGQSNLASISGVVTDPQGAVVPQTAIRAINSQTGLRHDAVTNAAGFYLIQNLEQFLR